MTEAARRHVAVQKIYVADKTGVEERRLICGCLAAADQRALARSAVFLELFAQCLEGLSLQRTDGTTEAVQNIAFEKSPRVVRQVLRPGGFGEGADSLDRGARVFPLLLRYPLRHWLDHGIVSSIRFRRSGNNHVRPSNLAAPSR